jgi:DNA-binding NtrC family response regulator
MGREDEAPAIGDEPASTLEVGGGERSSPVWQVEGASCLPFARCLGEGERLVIGSDTSTDLRVFDRSVSGRHCALLVREGALVVEDLGSKNGVFVGGARVDRAYLGPGAAFVVGRVVMSCRPAPRLATGTDDAPCSLPGVVGESVAMRRVVREALRVAAVKGSVLLRGETGSGKDILARAVHAMGPRRSRPFVPLNVGTLPRELADSELFGHERGAFTGAHAARAGAFVEAHGGTLFLDEIAELPPDLQVKLLRVLEDGEVRPIGSRGVRRVDVRVISATWAPLHRRVAEGAFRQDLYQRLAVFVIDVPPLRERRTDIPLLAARFLSDLEPEVGPRELSPSALARLASYGWPGNVRELRNVLYRAALVASDKTIRGQDIADSLDAAGSPHRLTISPDQARAVVVGHGGNVSAAARQLGVARSTFRGLLHR